MGIKSFKFIIMKKLTLYLLFIVAFCSCALSEKQHAEFKNNLIKEYNDSIESNSNRPLTNSKTLLEIELLTTKNEYSKKIKQLVKSGKLNYKNGYLVYKFEFERDNAAYGVITPNFHNGKLYQIEITTIMEDEVIDRIISPLMKATFLHDIYDKKYSNIYKKFYMYNDIVSELKVAWIGDGIEILIDGGTVKYTALSEQKNIIAEKQNRLNKKIDDL